MATASILIVEDSRTQARTLQRLLETAGYGATVAQCAEEALAFLGEPGRPLPDLVLSDIVMPGIDGFELCRRVKDGPATAAIPVVLMTALHDLREVLRALRAGADTFVTKPYRRETLLSRLAAALENARTRPDGAAHDGIVILVADERHVVQANPRSSVGLLLAAYESAVERNLQLERAAQEAQEARGEIESLAASVRLLVDSTPVAAAVVGEDGTTLYSNAAASALLGWSGQDARGRPFPVPFSPGESMRVGFPDGFEVDVKACATSWEATPATLVVLTEAGSGQASS